MILCIVGPTGVGKTKLSIELAKRYNGIVVNADSMQVYKELNGEEKLQKALEQASTLLMEKGINVSEVELRTLIESAVYGIKNGFNTLEIKASTPEQLTIPESMETTLVDVKTEA